MRSDRAGEESKMSFIALLAIALVTSIACQKFMLGIVRPAIVTAVLSTLAFHAIGFVVEGSLDSLVLVSFVVVLGLSFAISLGIGAAMRQSGKKG